MNALAINGLDAVLTKDILQQLELEDTLASDFGQLSLNALAGTAQGEALVVRALIQNKVMLILIDSGSSHSFISQTLVHRLNIPTVPMLPQKVKLANGTTLVIDQWITKLTWWSEGHTIQTDMKVLDIPAYDAILGYDWLHSNSPMNCNWAAKTLEFQQDGKLVKLQGIQPQVASISEISITQVQKWVQGNDVWAMAVVEPVTEDHPQHHQKAIHQLLHQYQDVFQEPQQLPPTGSMIITSPLYLVPLLLILGHINTHTITKMK